MSGVRRFIARLRNALRPGRAEADGDRELASHLLLLEDDYRRRGLPLDRARRAARLALGGLDQTREQHRDARAFRWIDDVRRDVVYATRMLRRHPIATVTSVLSLAIGVGLNAAVFSVVDWVLLRPLPYPASHELVHVFTAGTSPVTGPSALTPDEVAAFAAAAALQESVAFTTAARVIAGTGLESAHGRVARFTGNLFATLSIEPAVGRGFTPDEIAAGAPVVVVAHEVWQRQFVGVGRTILIEGAPYTVIGIMPAGRGYPRDAQFWRPLTRAERADEDRDLSMIGRLRPGTPTAAATAEIATMASALSNGARRAWLEDVQRTDVGSVEAALRALFAATLLTLLIACANVAALVGARGADRAGEMALRGALGAPRWRLFEQLMIESLLLAVAGGAVGLLLGRWALAALVALAPVDVPRLSEVTLDGRIIGLGLAVSLVAGLVVGLAPALQLSKTSRPSALHRLAWRRTTARPRTRRGLVLAQIAIAVMLTSGAGLLLRSLQHLVSIDHGFDPDRLIAVNLSPPRSFSGDAQRLFQELAAATATIPGVEAVALSMPVPTQVRGLTASVTVPGGRASAGRAVWRPVDEHYFATVGIPVTSGRRFLRSDGARAPRVAIVNTTFARDLLGSESPLGSRVMTSFANGPLSIVGVAGDVTPAGEADRPAIYVPVEQSPIGEGHLLVRAERDPRPLVPALRNRLGAMAPDLAFDRITRVAETLEGSRAITRFTTQLTTAFAAMALLLATIGVYGLTANDVSARRREMAIRMALGASDRGVLWTVIRPCASVLAAGATLGVLGAVSAGPALRSLLHGIGPGDAPSLAIAPLLLGSIGGVAALVAGRRALRTDPATTLRSE
jgi:predicted permease